jgi:hypothetical protein
MSTKPSSTARCSGMTPAKDMSGLIESFLPTYRCERAQGVRGARALDGDGDAMRQSGERVAARCAAVRLRAGAAGRGVRRGACSGARWPPSGVAASLQYAPS